MSIEHSSNGRPGRKRRTDAAVKVELETRGADAKSKMDGVMRHIDGVSHFGRAECYETDKGVSVVVEIPPHGRTFRLDCDEILRRLDLVQGLGEQTATMSGIALAKKITQKKKKRANELQHQSAFIRFPTLWENGEFSVTMCPHALVSYEKDDWERDGAVIMTPFLKGYEQKHGCISFLKFLIGEMEVKSIHDLYKVPSPLSTEAKGAALIVGKNIEDAFHTSSR